MADTTIQKQGEVFISQSEYDALRLAGNLQSNTKYHITKTPKTGVDSLEQMNLLNGDKTVDYNSNEGMTINGQARFTYDGGTTKDVNMDIDVPIVAGEGITIDKVNGQEKVEVKLDTALTDGKYVSKISSPGYEICYVTSMEGKDGYRILENNANEFTVPIRLEGGTVRVGTAVDDSDAMPKKQVEDGFVKKVTTGNREQVYTVDANNQQQMSDVSYNPDAWTFPKRYEGGRLQVGTPVGVNDATNKAYVDGLHHYTHIVSLVGSSSTIYITIAAKNYPNPITAIDDAGSTPSLSDLLLASGQSAKAMATGLITDLDGNKGTVVALWSNNGTVMVDFIVNGTLSSNAVLDLGTYTITDIVA